MDVYSITTITKSRRQTAFTFGLCLLLATLCSVPCWSQEPGAGEDADATSDSAYKIKLELFGPNKDGEVVAKEPGSDGRLTLQVGQVYYLEATNLAEEGEPVYVTILEIMPDKDIQVIVQNEELEPGGKKKSDEFACDKEGSLYEILLATPEPLDFIDSDAVDTSGYSQVIHWHVVPEGGGRGVDPVVTTSNGQDPSEPDYHVVQVFYGTDRKPSYAMGMPLIPLGVGALTLILILLVGFGRRRKTWMTLAIVGACATIWLGFNDITTRIRKAQALARTGIQYGGERGELDVGICEVSIPKDHRIGELEAPSILRLEVREDPTKHVMINDIIRKEPNEFYDELKSVVQASSRKEVFLFVHGYNVSFEKAARRTGQMAYDLKFEGAPIFYSWPSQAGTLQYTVDENNVKWTVGHLKQFLLDVTHKSDAESVNLIAHSMGNRALTDALHQLSLELREEKRLFNQVILAAPDVDAAVFKEQIVPAITKTAKHVTLYASSNDNALKASMVLHQNPRAGESGDNIVVTEGIDTIDVSSLDTDMLGHSYYGDSDSVVADIFALLHKAEPADKRPWLHQTLLGELRYWVFKGDDSDVIDEASSL